jgi:hypothetical protein
MVAPAIAAILLNFDIDFTTSVPPIIPDADADVRS